MRLVLLGTSSWRHRAWQRHFYPPSLEERDQLAYYAEQFGCVEISESFYRLPEHHTLAHWVEETPNDFRLALVAPRTITHYKKLKNCENQIDTLFTRLRGLEKQIGPVVFRLPPGWQCNLRRLEEFIQRLPDNFRHVFEFQDTSWHTPEVYRLLKNNRAGLSMPSHDDSAQVMTTAIDLIYLRLYSPKNSTTGIYHARTLRGWAGRIHGWTRKGKTVYVLFDGENRNAMLKNAQRLGRYLSPMN